MFEVKSEKDQRIPCNPLFLPTDLGGRSGLRMLKRAGTELFLLCTTGKTEEKLYVCTDYTPYHSHEISHACPLCRYQLPRLCGERAGRRRLTQSSSESRICSPTIWHIKQA